MENIGNQKYLPFHVAETLHELVLGDGAAAGQVVPVVLQQHQRDRRVLAALVVGVPAPDPEPITAQCYNTPL